MNHSDLLKERALTRTLISATSLLILQVILALPLSGLAQTAFTYQGRLADNGAPANGSYDLRFAIYDAPSNGVEIIGALTNAAASVSNGLFTVQLDFGAGVFTGADRWLQIGVRANGGGAFTDVSPRQKITATPYAIQAATAAIAASANSVAAANISGTMALAQLPGGILTNTASGVSLSGSFTGNASALSNLNSANLTGTVADAQLSTNIARLNATQTFAGLNTFGNSVGISSNRTLQFGAGLPGQESNAGKIGYQTFTPGALDIVGAGTNGSSRRIKFWAEGGATFSDQVTASAFNGSFTGNAAGLTNLNAGNVTGTLGDARLSPNVPLLNGTNFFTATNVLSGVLIANNSKNSLNGIISGDGSGLFVLNASAIASGTLDPNRIAGLDASKLTSGTLDTNRIPGIDASKIASGALADARLSSNVALLNGTNLFAGTNRFASALFATNVNNQINGFFTGNGGGLTNLNPVNLTAGTAAINISGNAATATTAATATSFSGSLAGDVTGTQGATVVATVGGQSAANVASGASAANAATSANTANTIVKRDASGNFNAGGIAAATFIGDGGSLTNLNAASLAGTVADARLSSNVALLNGTNVFAGTNRFAGVIVVTNVNNQIIGTFIGNGSTLTNLSAANLSGTVADARLSSNVTLLNGTNVFIGTNRFAGLMLATNVNNQFIGNGSALTSLNAGNLASGTVADARLTTNVALRAGGNLFSGSQEVADTVVAGPAALDQQQLSSTSVIGAADQWQSFTAGTNGLLAAVALAVGSPLGSSTPSPGTISIYAGEGTGGTLLATQSVTWIPGLAFQTNAVTVAPALSAGSQYTIRFSAPSATFAWVYYGADGYAGGRSSVNVANDFLFRTFMVPTRAGSSILMVNPAGNSGFVGIGTNAPKAKLHVVGAVLADGDFVASGIFSGNGAGLTGLVAANLTGNIPAASLTSVPADSLTGTLPDARLSSNVALLNVLNVFTGTNRFAGAIVATNVNNQLNGTFTGSGASLTTLNATAISSGTLPDSRLSTNVALLTGGTLPDSRLTTNVALRAGGNLFSGSQRVADTIITGVQALDQQQLTAGSGTGNTDQWQSFTAGTNGFLTMVALDVGSPLGNSPSSGTIQIYAGEGIGGTLLASQSITWAAGAATFQYNTLSLPPLLSAGAKYTIRFGAPSMTIGWVQISNSDLYAGGRSDLDANRDYLFRTYMSSSTTNATIMVVNPPGSSGFVGIGTNSPQARLHVAGNIVADNIGLGTTTPTLARLQIANSPTRTGSGLTTYWAQHTVQSWGSSADPGGVTSIYADGRIVGLGFVSNSDERIKRVAGLSDATRDLRTLMGIEVTDYSYVDAIAKGTGQQKKVIAQQVERVFPQAVSRSTDVVPDIFQKAAIQDGWIKLATNLKKGERVRLFGKARDGIHEVLEVADGKFRTDFAADADQVFVYGREVKDFRSVDYEAIGMLNVSATQELARKLQTQERELAELRSEVATLRGQRSSLAQSVSELDEAWKVRFARLERALAATSARQEASAPARLQSREQTGELSSK